MVVPLVFYLSNSKDVRDHTTFDRVVVWLSSPVQWLVVSTLDGISNTWSRYVALVGVEEENGLLRREVARLRGELAYREEQALENQRLRRLLQLHDQAPTVKAITAQVIATSPTPLFRSVRVARGTDDGVHVGAAVVNQDGVVGRVAAVTASYADVMLLVDANSSTDVLVQRTRARARVRGMGGDGELGVRVEYLPRTEDVLPGDVLVTSGLGRVFPKGLRVGRVISVERGAFGLYQEARIDPSVDFQRLEEVLILPEGFSPSTTFDNDLDAQSIAPSGSAADGGAATGRSIQTLPSSASEGPGGIPAVLSPSDSAPSDSVERSNEESG